MQTVTELTAQPEGLVQSNKCNKQESERKADVLWEIWIRFTNIYANTFTVKYGTEPNDEWANQLSGITQEQLSNGFNQLRDTDQFKTFPPNPIEFYCLCIGRERPQKDDDGNDATWQQKRIESADREHKALPKSLLTKEQNLEKIRSIKKELGFI